MISKGNHVKFARFVLLDVSEEAKTRLRFFFVQCIIKPLFAISKIIKVSIRVIIFCPKSTKTIIIFRFYYYYMHFYYICKNTLLFNFHTLYEFRFSDWLICTT